MLRRYEYSDNEWVSVIITIYVTYLSYLNNIQQHMAS